MRSITENVQVERILFISYIEDPDERVQGFHLHIEGEEGDLATYLAREQGKDYVLSSNLFPRKSFGRDIETISGETEMLNPKTVLTKLHNLAKDRADRLIKNYNRSEPTISTVLKDNGINYLVA